MLSLGAQRNGSFGAFACLAAAFFLTSARADAHFKIDAPTSWMSQDMVGGPQKKGPCAAMGDTALGDPQGTPTNTVTVEKSGTITVSVTVTIAHPGWFRVSLAEGPSSSQTLTTLPDPVAVNGTSCTPALMHGLAWSSTQPIIVDGLGLPTGSTSTTTIQTGTQTFQVTIPPAATCTSARPCTLQVIMMMTDHPVTDCYYHHCGDFALETTADASAGDSTVASSTADAAAEGDASLETTDANGAPSSTSADSEGSSGSSGAGASGGSSGSSSAGASPGGTGGSPNGTSAGSGASSAASSSGAGVGANTGASPSSGASSEPPSSSSGCTVARPSPGGTHCAIAALGFFALGSVRRRGRKR